MAVKGGVTFYDESGEKSRVDLYFADLTAGNIATIPDQLDISVGGSLAQLIAACSLCIPIKSDISYEVSKAAQVKPGNANAQREIGISCTYTDNVTGALYHFTIPGGDLANLLAAGTDHVDTTKAAWQALKTAFETYCKSPVGNAVTLVSGKLVGRSN